MEGFKIEVDKRELSSKKSFVKSIRNIGSVPGVYYSHDSKQSIPFSVNEKLLNQIEHLWTDHKKLVIGVVVVMIILAIS